MGYEIQLSEAVRKLLCCPICHLNVLVQSEEVVCLNCKTKYPVLKGIPVLLNEEKSLFTIEDFVTGRDTTLTRAEDPIRKTLRHLKPSISANISAKKNYLKFAELLLERNGSARVLIIGGSQLGRGMESLTQNEAIELVETDVSFGERTSLICDAHDIPFVSDTFDGVVLQAVLEHVIDPSRCVEEVHRVLKENGLVYAETPFMQQVHGGKYDYTRFTLLGHRRLFRMFAEIDSGMATGPGMALAWSYEYFLMSFTTPGILRSMIRFFSAITSFYLKYFDYYLVKKDAALDAASGIYFMGRKSQRALSDRDIIKLYRGTL